MMSETTENVGGTTAADRDISADDVKRMLGEIRKVKEERDSALERARAAERERDDASSRVVSAAEQEYNARVAALDAEIGTVKSEAERLEDDYVAAREAADARAEARANRLLNQADRKAEQLAERKRWMEANKAQLIAQAAPRSTRGKYAAVGLVEEAIMPEEREWLDARPQFLTDKSYRGKVLGASNYVEASGHKRGSAAYFREIEKMLGEAGEEQGNGADEHYEEAEPSPPPRQRPISSDLAPQRHAPGRPPANAGNEIRLNTDEQEMADMMYGNPQSPDYLPDRAARFKKYYQNKRLMEQKGRFSR